jgi:hypothetical protein
MSAADLLKILMLLGLCVAVPAIVWLGRNNKKLEEEIRLERARLCGDDGES